ncbi:MAG: hypothetical protein MSG64_19265 [Pyrinomonadaceae bacterium MAG19_C2-C3]|nr:hypothetical protein [Pyrinomonadaceae bacterium MAG19_C2-C3]
MSDELKSAVSLLHRLDFPSGVLAALGGFCFGVGVFYGEVNFDNRKIILGAFLLSLAATIHYFSGLIELKYIDLDNQRIKRGVRWSWIIPFLLSLALTVWSGSWLWALIHMPKS